MRESLRAAILDLIDRLASLTERELSPLQRRAEVRAALGGLEHRVVLHWDAHRRRHDATVIVDDPELGGAMTFEARGTSQGQPLTLLATQSWSERAVVRVNGRVIEVSDVIANLDFLWNEARIASRLIDRALLEDELEREPVAISDAELQAGVDGFRARHGLSTVDDTLRWLRERGLSFADVEDMVEHDLALTATLRRLTPGWLDAARTRATIEWNWGTRTATDRLEQAIRGRGEAI